MKKMAQEELAAMAEEENPTIEPERGPVKAAIEPGDDPESAADEQPSGKAEDSVETTPIEPERRVEGGTQKPSTIEPDPQPALRKPHSFCRLSEVIEESVQQQSAAMKRWLGREFDDRGEWVQRSDEGDHLAVDEER
jgi:hypothetical protein